MTPLLHRVVGSSVLVAGLLVLEACSHTTMIGGTQDSVGGSSNSSVSSSSSSSSSSGSTSSSRRAVLNTDGGSVEVAAEGDVLKVTSTSVRDDWQFHIDHQDDQRIELSFAKEGASSIVVIELTPSGIRSSVSSRS